VVASAWLLYLAVVPDTPVAIRAATLVLIACTVPATFTSGLRGAIEGAGDFFASACLRTLSAPIFILFPLAASAYDATPLSVAVGFLGGRIAVAGLYHVRQARSPGVIKRSQWSRARGPDLREVIAYSGWVGVSNVVGTLVGYLDRILIPFSAGLSQMAFYALPFEIASRLLIIPGALVTVVFPSLSALRHDRGATHAIVRDAYWMCLAGALPLAVLLATFSRWLLFAWMGESFANESVIILQWLCAGVVFNALAHVPFCALQALGTPRTAALMHLAEAIPAALLFFAMIALWGAIGAAVAWTIRAFVDLALMHWAWRRELRRVAPYVAPVGDRGA
jgi:O-antigen/teichoic acid export membrane protein